MTPLLVLALLLAVSVPTPSPSPSPSPKPTPYPVVTPTICWKYSTDEECKRILGAPVIQQPVAPAPRQIYVCFGDPVPSDIGDCVLVRPAPKATPKGTP